LKKSGFRTALIVIGLLLVYTMEMSPSPALMILREEFDLFGKDTVLNLSISIIFLPIVAASMIGPAVERRIGTRKLYLLSMAFVSASAGIYLLCGRNYMLFLIGRMFFGVGFGFSMPFIGSAIMKWFPERHRETMNTVNSLFPFFGTLISYFLVVPICNLLGWEWSQAIWGMPVAAVFLLWLFVSDSPEYGAEEVSPALEKNTYIRLWKCKEIRMCCITFVCDFICYSYLSAILPTYLLEACKVSEMVANLYSAIAFPLIGIFGTLFGGMLVKQTGLRKPSLVWGQVLKLIGIVMMVYGTGISDILIIFGVAVFAFGCAQWMPAMYCIPMDLGGLDAQTVGAAFAFMGSCGLASGFFAPALGGFVTNLLMRTVETADAYQAHLFGLKWSVFLFGLLNIVGIICMIRIRETGKRRVQDTAKHA